MSSLPHSAPGSTSTLRVANQQRVLDLLRRTVGTAGIDEAAGGPAVDAETFTQAEIARGTGLAPATVSNIVRDLAAAGLVAADPGSGRRGSAVRLAPGAGTVAGVDFGHSHVAV
ncbi:MAG: MarR family transcriptional regulator, partial [Actinobacteria bacterium]|nr:MarR family transcriptional regulator [Actinomycetota bacterium]